MRDKMERTDECRIQAYEAAIDEFNEKGLKFTMDDISRRLGISKKTLYTLFKDKEELFLQTVEYGFAAVKESETNIINNSALSLVDKIRKIIVVLPDKYHNVDFRKLYALKEKYPKIYQEVETRIENDWEPTLSLIQEGMNQGILRKVRIPVLKAMIEASIEHFLNSEVLIREGITYDEALNEMIETIMQGIILK